MTRHLLLNWGVSSKVWATWWDTCDPEVYTGDWKLTYLIKDPKTGAPCTMTAMCRCCHVERSCTHTGHLLLVFVIPFQIDSQTLEWSKSMVCINKYMSLCKFTASLSRLRLWKLQLNWKMLFTRLFIRSTSALSKGENLALNTPHLFNASLCWIILILLLLLCKYISVTFQLNSVSKFLLFHFWSFWT